MRSLKAYWNRSGGDRLGGRILRMSHFPARAALSNAKSTYRAGMQAERGQEKVMPGPWQRVRECDLVCCEFQFGRARVIQDPANSSPKVFGRSSGRMLVPCVAAVRSGSQDDQAIHSELDIPVSVCQKLDEGIHSACAETLQGSIRNRPAQSPELTRPRATDRSPEQGAKARNILRRPALQRCVAQIPVRGGPKRWIDAHRGGGPPRLERGNVAVLALSHRARCRYSRCHVCRPRNSAAT